MESNVQDFVGELIMILQTADDEHSSNPVSVVEALVDEVGKGAPSVLARTALIFLLKN